MHARRKPVRASSAEREWIRQDRGRPVRFRAGANRAPGRRSGRRRKDPPTRVGAASPTPPHVRRELAEPVRLLRDAFRGSPCPGLKQRLKSPLPPALTAGAITQPKLFHQRFTESA